MSSHYAISETRSDSLHSFFFILNKSPIDVVVCFFIFYFEPMHFDHAMTIHDNNPLKRMRRNKKKKQPPHSLSLESHQRETEREREKKNDQERVQNVTHEISSQIPT